MIWWSTLPILNRWRNNILAPDDLCISGSLDLVEGALFQNLELRVVAGQWTCLLGRSGVGKTTILRLLAGLPVHGAFKGTITKPDRIAYMAQSDLLLPWLDVVGNVLLGSKLRGEKPDITRANALIERVGLTEHRHKKPSQLSGGMRQRAALARTLMEDCPVVLLDEPFSALDAGTRADMQELAFELLKEKTCLLVTHDPGEAARLAHTIIIMTDDGIDTIADIKPSPIREHDLSEKLDLEAQLLRQLRAHEASEAAA